MDATALRISVVCPIHNTLPDLLHAAACSVIATAGRHLHELLLVDDASTNPQTLAAIQQIAAADARVVVVRQPCNGGPAAARNQGIGRASGDWIGFIDSDDLWLAGRLEAALSVLAAYPDAGWIAGNFESLYRDGTTEAAALISRSCLCVRLRDDMVLLKSPELTRHLIGNFWLNLGGSIIKTELIKKIGGLPAGSFYYYEDCIFLARLSVVASCYFVEKIIYTYRRDISSLTSSSRRLTDAYAAGWRQARRDKLLRKFRKEMRWVSYKIYKELAINTLLNARRWQAFWFASRAWLLDPREIGEFSLFLRLFLRRNLADHAASARRYSTAERFMIGLSTQGAHKHD